MSEGAKSGLGITVALIVCVGPMIACHLALRAGAEEQEAHYTRGQIVRIRATGEPTIVVNVVAMCGSGEIMYECRVAGEQRVQHAARPPRFFCSGSNPTTTFHAYSLVRFHHFELEAVPNDA